MKSEWLLYKIYDEYFFVLNVNVFLNIIFLQKKAIAYFGISRIHVC